MKIAMIGAKGIPAVSGGVERHVEELAARLAAMGHTVTVYNRRGYAPRGLKETRSIRLREIFTVKNKFLEAPIYSLFASVRALIDRQELFHYHALGPAMMAFLPRLFGKKTVVTVHGLDWQRAKWGRFARAYLKWCETAAIVFPHKTIVVSNKLKKYFGGKYEKRAGKIECIPNGVTPAQAPAERKMAEKYGLEHKKYILFLARLVPEKGCHTLLKAFDGLDCDVKLVVAGGSSHSDEYCRELYQYASDKIIFTGEVFGDQIKELYSGALFYVLPSEIEGMPISLLEAMSYGLCPLVSDIEENMEVLLQLGGCGFSFRSGDAGNLRERLLYLLAHPGDVAARGALAQEYVTRTFDWDTAADKTEATYLSIGQAAAAHTGG